MKQSDDEALKWYLSSAKRYSSLFSVFSFSFPDIFFLVNRGYPPAQHAAALLFLSKKSNPFATTTTNNTNKTLGLLREAADGGYLPAYQLIGKVYLEGLGVKKDEKEAMKWFLKAAEHGDAEGARSVGLMYLKVLFVVCFCLLLMTVIFREKELMLITRNPCALLG